MAADSISTICVGAEDVMGDPIRTIYSKVGNVYAIYLTPKRVKIQFADDDTLMFEQRRALSPLTPLRGEIDSILDEWRAEAPTDSKLCAKVGIFDRRTADALAVALQGDQAHAETLLRALKEDILEEKKSIGRVSYLLIATGCALAVFLAFMLLSLVKAVGAPGPMNSITSFIAYNKVGLAAGFGALGALFSIAIGIRKRDLMPDMQRRDNVVDAVLRIMIGVVSAVILFSLLRSELVALAFGANQAQFGTGSPTGMHVAIVVAFVAGFTEMLVGDYLAKAILRDRDSGAALRAATQDKGRETEANEHNPRGKNERKAELAQAAAAPSGAASSNGANRPDHAELALSDFELKPHDLVRDEELPAASGGIARAA